jgi:hypothetical protein
MSEPLATYLNDHLAGAALAVDLLEAMRDHHPNDSLGDFASAMLTEVESDRSELRRLSERVGSGSSQLKEMGAWFTEKVSRFKLDRGPNGLGTFEALEFLGLGVLGKLALWQALGAVSAQDDRLAGMDFNRLAARAREQHARVEAKRLEAAKMALLKH